MAVNKRLLQGAAAGGLIPSENFKVVTWTGNGSTQSITGLGFTPDFVWIKSRSFGRNHYWYDTTRGANKQILSNANDAEATITGRLTSFDTGGFTVGSSSEVNNSGETYVAWAWKANGGTTSSNTDGTITSTVQVNTDAGFSIVQFTTPSTFSGSNTVGHGLGATPDMILVKATSTTEDWYVYHTSTGLNKATRLNTIAAVANATYLWGTVNDTVFNPAYTSASPITNIAYCFKSTDGFSKFGTYTGNSSNNGPIVETGFEPAFLMIKNASDAGSWFMYDNKRNTSNPRINYVLANATNVEASDMGGVDFLSNGFQIKEDHDDVNDTGDTYIYMAFAADPDTEAPTLADSFDVQTYNMTGGSDYDLSFAFKPQFVVTKTRDEAAHWSWGDIIRGNNSNLSSNDTNAVSTTNQWRVKDWYAGATSVTIAQHASTNTSNVSYAWKADDNEPTIFGGPAIAVYKFEDNANDVTGDYNGTASNVTYSSSGKFNKAAEFNGSSSKIDLGDVEYFQGNFTMSMWFYPVTNTGTDFQVLGIKRDNALGQGDSTQEINVMLYEANQSTYPQKTLFAIGGGGTNYNILRTTNTYNFDTWNFITVKISGTSMSITLNGTETTGTFSGTRQNLSAEFRLGNKYGVDNDYPFNGKIDQVRIYNGAVSDIGVAALYAETASQNDDLELGGPPKSIVSANANAGFSIVKWEGTGTQTQIPHGLSAVPEMIISKRFDSTNNWSFYHKDLGLSHSTYPNWLYLNLSSAEQNSASSANHPYYARPSATVIYQNTGTSESTNVDGGDYISYCFHSVTGYSKIGSYTGTGSSQTITTGFTPDFVITKKTNGTDNWRMYDSVRQNAQPFDEVMYPNLSDGEDDNTTGISGTTATGFTLGTGNLSNNSGDTYIYMAFKIN